MLTAGFRWAPDTLPMNRITASTIRAGAVTAAVRLIVFGKAWLITPPPHATSTRKNVPSTSENSRRHSCDGSANAAIGPTISRSKSASMPAFARFCCSMS